MPINKQLYCAYRFFHENAGYVAGKSACGALRLARAELWAKEREIEFEWTQDNLTNREWQEITEHNPEYYLWACVARLDGECVASLCGIDFGYNRDPWMSDYKRVVEGELALEAIQDKTTVKEI